MKEYIELNLVMVDENGKIKYYAVDDDTEDNMFITESVLSYSNNPELRNTKMKHLGMVMVQKGA